jgi:hypothetical protein
MTDGVDTFNSVCTPKNSCSIQVAVCGFVTVEVENMGNQRSKNLGRRNQEKKNKPTWVSLYNH